LWISINGCIETFIKLFLTVRVYVSLLYYNFTVTCPSCTKLIISFPQSQLNIQEATIILSTFNVAHTQKMMFYTEQQPQKFIHNKFFENAAKGNDCKN
jgi:hypothetical protein